MPTISVVDKLIAEQKLQVIKTWDYSKAIADLLQEHPYLADKIPTILEQFQNFMLFSSLEEESVPMACKITDLLWHAFMLADTREYRKYCFAVKGDFIDHVTGGKEVNSNGLSMESLYQKYFGTSAPDSMIGKDICWSCYD